MSYSLTHRFGILCVILMILACQGAYGQSDNWNHVLDQYERICDQCIVLRRTAAEGGLVQKQTLSALLEQLLSLRTRLQNASGAMSGAQKERFVGIMRKYESAMSSSPRSLQARNAEETSRNGSSRSPLRDKAGSVTDSAQAMAVASTQPVIRPALPPMDREPLPHPAIMDLALKLKSSSSVLDGSVSPAPEQEGVDVRQKRLPRFFVMGQLQYSNALMAGIMAAYVPRKWGGYVSYRDNFRRVDGTEYSVSQDGHVYENKSGISVFWGNGESQFRSMRVTGGPVWRMNRYLMLYGGVGLGLRKLNWLDVDGSWAKVVDFSDKGVAWETGVVGSYRKLSLGVGLSCYKDVDLVLSFGLNF